MTVKQKTTNPILVKRDELVAKLAQLDRSGREAAREAAKATALIAPGEAELKQLRAKVALGAADLEEANQKWVEVDGRPRYIAERIADAEAFGDAKRQIESELQRLYAVNLEVFAEEAGQTTDAAEDAIADLIASYERAFAAWQAMRFAWGPLAPAILERVTEDENRTGVWRDRGKNAQASQPPQWPLANPNSLRSGIPAPRPAAMNPDETLADDADIVIT